MTLSYQFSGKGERKGGVRKFPGAGNQPAESETFGGVRSEPRDYTKIYYHPVTGEYIPGGWVYYLDPSVPWTVSFNYNYSYGKRYEYDNQKDMLSTRHVHTQTLGLSGQLRITKAFNINVNTNVDLSKFTLTTTQLSASYDLHCFNISVSWVPTGQWQSWSFRISATASALADLLKFKKGSSYWDNF